MLVYTYYTTETTRPTAKLTSRNFRQVFENEFTLVKTQPTQIHQHRNGAYYCGTHYGNISNISSVIKDRNSRLFTLLAPLQLHRYVHVSVSGNLSYLLFVKCAQDDGSFYYKCAVTSGDALELEELKRRLAPVEQVDDDQEVPEPIVQEVRAPRRRNNTPAQVEQVAPEVPVPNVDLVAFLHDAFHIVPTPDVEPIVRAPRRRNNTPARVEQVVPAKPKAIKFTINTECYICMMDFSEDHDVTINSCCMKLAHTACYSGIVQKSSCACCRATLE